MARRIDIELTSARPDGTWTWRAAGAREPKGVLDGSLLYTTAKAGDVVRAEADFELDGITIVSVAAPKQAADKDPNLIEIIGSGRADTPGVTTQLVGRADRRPSDRRRDRDDGRPRPPRDRDDGRPPRDRNERRPPRERDDSRPRDTDAPGRGNAGRGEHARDGATIERRPGGNRPRRQPDSAPGGGGRRPDAERRTERRAAAASAAPRQPKPRRFNPGHAHRQAVMAALAPEEQPIAEQVLRGGIPAVRTALHLERESAVAEGRPVPNTDQLIAMAEALLPRLKAAEWRDRAEEAVKEPDTIALRDLRAVVAGSDVARDEESRALASQLREALERRLDSMRTHWSDEVAEHLTERRVVRALRLAGRPPEPAARLDAELSTRLAQAASEAMAPDTASERWVALIDAVAESPVRRDVKPVGFPAEPGDDLRKVAHQQSGRIPALAAMLGITIPPPPVPSRATKRQRPERPARPRRERPAPSAEAPATEAPDAPNAEAPEAPNAEAPPAAEEVPASAPPAAEAHSAGAPTAEAPADEPAPDAAPTVDEPPADAPPESPSTEGGDDSVVVEELG